MRYIISALFALAVVPGASPAQIFVPDQGGNEGASAAYLALGITPVGALPASINPALVAGTAGIGYRFQFGYVDEGSDFSRRVLGAGLDFPLGRANLGITAGVTDFSCESFSDFGITIDLDCKSAWMGGLTLATRVMSRGIGDAGSRFDIGLDGTAGYATGDILDLRFDDGVTQEQFSLAAKGTTLTVGVPVSVTAKSGTFNFIPFIIPRFGWGNADMELIDELNPGLSEEVSESGVRFMLGGGLALVFGNGLGASVGFQKIFIEDGDTTIGFGLSWNR